MTQIEIIPVDSYTWQETGITLGLGQLSVAQQHLPKHVFPTASSGDKLLLIQVELSMLKVSKPESKQ